MKYSLAYRRTQGYFIMLAAHAGLYSNDYFESVIRPYLKLRKQALRGIISG